MDLKNVLQLRPTQPEDLDVLFPIHTDPEGLNQAAFTAKDPTNKSAFVAHWTKCLNDPTMINKTVWLVNELVGTLDYWLLGKEPNLSYWIDKTHRGKGIGTAALQLFLKEIDTRPLFARIAYDNFGSQRLLQKCGFKQYDEGLHFANARQAEIKELLFRLD